ncbi:MAG: hypothetical protein L3J03_12010 [Desulfobacterales bacterium]|nr:hypothetical protein [Desulfobacterales bacterium]
MASESPPRRSEFLLDSLFMNSRPFSMERPLVEEDPFPDRRGLLNVYVSRVVARPTNLIPSESPDRLPAGAGSLAPFQRQNNHCRPPPVFPGCGNNYRRTEQQPLSGVSP